MNWSELFFNCERLRRLPGPLRSALSSQLRLAGVRQAEISRNMILHSYPSSPYARKLRIAIQLLGLADRVKTRDADVNDPADPLRRDNPLGKVPALLLENGSGLYDSPVILEYLDHLAGGGRIIPREPEARFTALTLQALCDGALDASLLVLCEGWYRTPEQRVARWLDRHAGKVERALATLEAAPPALSGTPNVGQIALACLLGYRDFRFDGTWRETHPRLHAWHDAFAATVPAFASTTPIDA
jgi:glutathione S-transferase